MQAPASPWKKYVVKIKEKKNDARVKMLFMEGSSL